MKEGLNPWKTRDLWWWILHPPFVCYQSCNCNINVMLKMTTPFKRLHLVRTLYRSSQIGESSSYLWVKTLLSSGSDKMHLLYQLKWLFSPWNESHGAICISLLSIWCVWIFRLVSCKTYSSAISNGNLL